MSGTVLDLFCGAGGFSLGFSQSGFDVIAGIDNDEAAIKTYEANHDGKAIQADISEHSESCIQFLESHGIDADSIDVIIGGPPCQGYSVAGVRDPDDPRNNLVHIFWNWVEAIRPESVLMENVPGILTMDDGNIIESVINRAESIGYTVDYQILNSADYGVPQKRKRCFIQAKLDGDIHWPEPTHAPPDAIEEPVDKAGPIHDKDGDKIGLIGPDGRTHRLVSKAKFESV